MSDITNDDRAMWAAETLAVFVRRTRTDPENVLADFIADLRHLCDRINEEGWDFDYAVGHGTWLYEEEVAEEELEALGVTAWTLGEAGLSLERFERSTLKMTTSAPAELEGA